MAEDAASFGLSARVAAAIHSVLKRHERVKGAVVYGSRARGNYREGSDIDISLEGNALTSEDLLRIDHEIDGLDLPYRVDLSLRTQIEDPALRAQIAATGQSFYRAERR